MAMLRCMNCMEEYNEKQNKCPHCGYMKMQQAKYERFLPQETTLQRRYIVGNLLQENEQEIIYIGWDSVLEKKIAIKEYFPMNYAQRMVGQKELTSLSEEEKAQFMCGLERFISEAQQLARFREDTGMIRIYDNFEENGTAYTVVEYTESLRVPLVAKQPDVIDKWQQKKKVYYIGWSILAVAIMVVLVLLFFETRTEKNLTADETIPDIIGMSYQQAEKVLESFGVELQREKYCYSDALEEDTITCQSISEGTKLEKGMVVKVVVTSVYEDSTTQEQVTETDFFENNEKDAQESTEEITTIEEESSAEANATTQSTKRTTQQKVNMTTQETTKEKKTQKKEKKTTEKKTEKKTEQKKTTEKATAEKATEEEVIVIED